LTVSANSTRSDEVTYRAELALAAACGVLLVLASLLGAARVPAPWPDAVMLLALAAGAVMPLKETGPSLLRRRIDIDLLMLLAAFGAAWLGELGEGALLMFLFSGSGALESFTSRRTRQSIEALKGHLATTAVRLLDDGDDEEVAVEALAVGDRILIRPGARVPADGLVVAGESTVSQAALTGESMPVLKQAGDEVLGGTMNLQDGALTVTVSRPASDSTIARMIRLVEEAEANRAKTQVFTDWFGERYTVVVIVGVALAYLAFRYALALPFERALYRAMTLLVVASPCALVLATPAALLAAIATAARHGILVKGGGVFEQVAKVKVVVFDKTGTLTMGKPRVEEVIPVNGTSPDEIVRLAASVEHASEHPLAAAIVREAERRGLALAEATEFQAITGRGVIAAVEGRQIRVGSRRWFEAGSTDGPLCDRVTCPHHDPSECRALVVGAPHAIGLIDLQDTVRPSAAPTCLALHRSGLRLAMLTGDGRAAAAAVATAVGLDEVRAELMPAEKLAIIKEFQTAVGPVMMVGDGVNDAPALATAEVGVAMGGIGSDVALETADVVLTTDDLARLPLLVTLSKRAVRTVHQNLVVAISVIVMMSLLVLLTEQVRMPVAVLAHEGGTVLVVLNGLRLLRL